MRKVYPSFLIDPGHGGKDPGACGIEAKINLDISLCLKNLISELGLLCELTRHEDIYVSLQERVRLANMMKPSCLISIHCNAFDSPYAEGLEVWTSTRIDHSDTLATSILLSLGLTFPYNKKRYDYSDGDLDKETDTFYILRESKVPTVLLELGFLSNPKELAWLSSPANHRYISSAIATGALAWSY